LAKPSLQPGQRGERLPDGIIVLRLAKPSSASSDAPRAHESNFSLSSDDEVSELQSLSVWVIDLTPVKRAREFMGELRAQYRMALYLNVNDIRAIRWPSGEVGSPLDVVWDPLPQPDAKGHSGIIGLKRPPHTERSKYKALRVKLADLARAELLPD
jgi:hypothetical protein